MTVDAKIELRRRHSGIDVLSCAPPFLLRVDRVCRRLQSFWANACPTGLQLLRSRQLFLLKLLLRCPPHSAVFLCHQAVRIRQVADPAVGNMPSAVRQIVAESGWGKLYEGLPSILFRQISFGMMKFLVFDFFTGERLRYLKPLC